MSDFLRELTEGFNIADLGRDGETQPPQQETTLQQENVEHLWNESAFNGDLNNNVEGMINEVSIGLREHQSRKGRGRNKHNWAVHNLEKVQFNSKGQAEAPRRTCARFSRFIGMIAKEKSRFPVNITDWRYFRNGSAITDAWEHVKATLDWSDPQTQALENKIKFIVERKLCDRWKHFKATLRRDWYAPYAGTQQRFVCGDDRVHKDHWNALVVYWDGTQGQKRSATNIANRGKLKMSHTTGTRTFAQYRYAYRKKHGKEPDRFTFFKLTHTRGENEMPVDEASRLTIVEFNKRIEERTNQGIEMTETVMNEVYSEVLGPEKRNRVRGFGAGVSWVNVPGIITDRRGISREVHTLRQALEEQRVQNEEQRKANEQSEMAMQRLGEEQVKLREEHEASLARYKAELDASFTEKVQATVVMEMNSAMQAAGFSDLAAALEALRYVGNVNGSVNALPHLEI